MAHGVVQVILKKKERKDPITAASRAGLLFPVPRIGGFVRDHVGGRRVDKRVPLYIAGVQQRVVEIILAKAAENCRGDNGMINREALAKAICNQDLRLGKVTEHVFVGGVRDSFVPSLPPTSRKIRKRKSAQTADASEEEEEEDTAPKMKKRRTTKGKPRARQQNGKQTRGK